MPNGYWRDQQQQRGGKPMFGAGYATSEHAFLLGLYFTEISGKIRRKSIAIL
ncbi:MAG TPA: hypothetical protein VG672_13780 [Bryobacteraceae bacterium]|nr:hypothetical protein [Bryobacteraceae bacterium]